MVRSSRENLAILEQLTGIPRNLERPQFNVTLLAGPAPPSQTMGDDPNW